MFTIKDFEKKFKKESYIIIISFSDLLIGDIVSTNTGFHILTEIKKTFLHNHIYRLTFQSLKNNSIFYQYLNDNDRITTLPVMRIK